MALLDDPAAVAGQLAAALGPTPTSAAEADQPVHTLYWPADRFDARTVTDAGAAALALFDQHLAEPGRIPAALGWPAPVDAALAEATWTRTRAALQARAVQDVRIDFEDGYGRRDDATEDAHADAAADALAEAIGGGGMCARAGIRIKTITPAEVERAAATLERFVGRLGEAGRWPETFVVTVPKVTHPEQVRLVGGWLDALERRHRRPEQSLRLEVMVETTASLVDADGRSPLPAIVDAGVPRLLGVHLGVYDFTASMHLPPAQQAPDHVYCDLARGSMRLAVGGRVHLSDGASNVRPVGDATAVQRAWRIGYAHVQRALAQGYLQGWDMHPGQLVVRHAANVAFWRRGYDELAARLSVMLDTATRGAGANTVEGAVIDEPATAAALYRAVARAWRVRAIDERELAAAGLRPQDLTRPSFAAVVHTRRNA